MAIRQAPVAVGRTSRILRGFSSERHLRGCVDGTSRNPNSANSQFFIVFDDASWLDSQYGVGIRHLGYGLFDQIKGSPAFGKVDDPDKSKHESCD